MTSGKFGIGTASPGTPVHIVAPAVQMTVEGTANQSVQMELIDHQSNAKKWRLVSGMNNRGGLQIYQATNNIEAVEISPNGNVGLGMVVPSDKLDVAGNIRLSGGAKSILFSDPGNYDFSIVHNGGSSLDIRSPEYNTTIASFFNNGNVGIGTNNPVDLLHLLQTNSSGLRWERAGYDTYRMGLMGQGFSVHNVTRNRYDLVIDGTTGNVGMGMTNPAYRLDVSGTIRGVVISPSDRNLKKNIHPMTPDTLDKVTRLNGKSFEWDKNRITSMREEQLKKSGSHSQKSPVVDEPSADFPMGPQLGLIAQEVEELFPQLVQTDNNGVKSISYMGITAVLVEGMKTQQKQIVALREEVSQLKKKLK